MKDYFPHLINKYLKRLPWLFDQVGDLTIRSESNTIQNSQGYYGLLSAIYFNGDATSTTIAIEDVDVWQDVVMTIQDEDGGRLDSRLFLERHSAALPAEDFPINAAGLAMESGADEEYPHLVNVQFFVGDTINTNAPGDAGKIRFQIKSDVAGTILMNEIALFIQF